MKTKIYLGNHLYCQYDGQDFILTAENGLKIPLTTIVLDKTAISLLMDFIETNTKPPPVKENMFSNL